MKVRFEALPVGFSASMIVNSWPSAVTQPFTMYNEQGWFLLPFCLHALGHRGDIVCSSGRGLLFQYFIVYLFEDAVVMVIFCFPQWLLVELSTFLVY